MRAREFILLEYNREKTIANFGDKIFSAFLKDTSYDIRSSWLVDYQIRSHLGEPLTPEEKQLATTEIIKLLEQGDPTANKQYMRWIANVYATQNIKIEDVLSTGKENLTKFHNYKTANILPAEYRDIGRLTYANLVEIAMDRQLQKALSDKTGGKEQKELSPGNATLFYENDKVRIIVPEDKDAACYYGEDTQWCTAATRAKNLFDYYNAKGTLYILLPKQPEYDGEKYQLHFETDQFMDEQDIEVNDPVWLIKERFGDLSKLFNVNDYIVFVDADTIDAILDEARYIAADYIGELYPIQERQDQEWIEHLKQQGFVYPEGDENAGEVDWDSVDISYLDWQWWVSDQITDTVSKIPDNKRELDESIWDSPEALAVGMKELPKIIGRIVGESPKTIFSDDVEQLFYNEYTMKKDNDGKWGIHYTHSDS